MEERERERERERNVALQLLYAKSRLYYLKLSRFSSLDMIKFSYQMNKSCTNSGINLLTIKQ